MGTQVKLCDKMSVEDIHIANLPRTVSIGQTQRSNLTFQLQTSDATSLTDTVCITTHTSSSTDIHIHTCTAKLQSAG